MSLADYSGLKLSVQAWLGDRTDLATLVDDCILLTESRLNKRLRTRDMETSTTLTPTSGVCTIPTDYLEFRSVEALTNPVRILELIDQGFADDNYGDGTTGTPAFFTINGTSLTIYPPSDDDIRLKYYRTVVPLTVSNTTNWLLTREPRIYLNGCLAEASRYLMSDRAGYYDGLFEQAVQELMAEDKSGRWSRANMRIRGVTP
jgi:hypothetical protein